MTQMTTVEFLGLEQTGETTWSMEVLPRTIGGHRGALFGGCGLAAAVEAMWGTTKRTPVWVSAQYASAAGPPARIDFTVELPMVGFKTTQARVTGTSEGSEILTAIGAFGERTEHVRGEWETMPSCCEPEQGEEVERMSDGESVHSHTETRMARGMFGFTGTGTPSGDNRSLVWVRLRNTELDTGALALLADYMTSSVGNAVGQLVRCTSLDNTIRYHHPVQPDSDWVLCDNRVSFVGNGFASGDCLMWSRNGSLLATASQTMTVALQ